MGLFDIFCDQHGIEWQTKSFMRPSLDRYRVTSDGHLEKGEPLDLPLKYCDNDITDLIAFTKRLAQDGPRFAWTRHNFTGTVQTLTVGSDGEMRESKFEFRDGTLC